MLETVHPLPLQVRENVLAMNTKISLLVQLSNNGQVLAETNRPTLHSENT